MRNLKYIIIVPLFISACGGSEDEIKTNEFLSNFEEIELPHSFTENDKKEKSELIAIELKFVDIVTDTVERNKYNNSFEFYYVGKIETNKDYNIIIVCENVSSVTQTYMPYQLITLSESGEIVSTLDFSVLEQNREGKDYSTLHINKSFEIEIVYYSKIWNDDKEVLQSTSEYIIEDNGNINFLEPLESDKATNFKAFKKLNLPYEIKTHDIGNKIKDRGFITTVYPKYFDKQSLKFNLNYVAFFSVGMLHETEKYTAIIYRKQSEGCGHDRYPFVMEYFLMTFDSNKKIISKKSIGMFSAIDDVTNRNYQLTETNIVINPDFTISSHKTFTLSEKEPNETSSTTILFSIQPDGKITQEQGQSDNEQKLSKLLSKEIFEYIMKAKENYEQIKTAKQIEQIFSSESQKVESILNNMIAENNPNETDLTDKWEFIGELLPFIIITEGAEGMGVYAIYNTYLLSLTAKETPSAEDDLFFEAYNEIHEIENREVKQYGAPNLVEWITDVEAYSKLGNGKFLRIFELIQKALNKPTCFEKALNSEKKQVLLQLDYSSFLYSKEQVLKQIEKIIAEINFSDDEIKIINDAQKEIRAKKDSFFNLKN